MKQPLRARPCLEQLEARWCPALTATVNNGILTVTGAAASPSDTITVKETVANTFEVDDNGTAVSSGLSNVNSVRIALTGTAGHILDVDLGTFTLAGNLSVNLGGGTNTATVTDGTISGRLTVLGGSGTDAVTLGGTGTLSVGKDTLIGFGAAGNDSLTLDSGVSLSGNLITEDANNLTLAKGSSVAKTLPILGGSAGNTIDVEGTVGQDLAVLNPFFGGNQQSSTALTLGAAASVGQDLVFINSPFGNGLGSQLTTKAGSKVGHDLVYLGSGQGDVVDLAGSIGNNAVLALWGGNNKATLESGASVAGHAAFLFGNGNNSLTVDGTVGTSGNTDTALLVLGGRGNDTVTLHGSATVNGNAQVLLSSGVNTLDLRDGATITGTLTARGGGNAGSTFRGSSTKTHPTLNVTGFPITNGSPNP
jgi:hypothetical protein